MASERDQDKWLDRLMHRQNAEAAEDRGAGACLDVDTLAAWSDGVLRGRALAAAEMHASTCPRCLALVAALERTAPDVPAAAPKRGTLFRWLVPLAAAATAIAIWVTIPDRKITSVATQSAPAVSVPTQVPTPAPVLPAPAEEVLQPKVLPQQAPSARLGELRRQSRNESMDLKAERDALADAETKSAQAAPPPAAAAPPPRQAESVGDTLYETTTTARRTLNKAIVIEAVGADRLIRWRVTSGTDVERSTDGGQTWVKTASPPAPVVSIRDVDALRATVTTSEGNTFSTTDGGATWAPVQEKPAAPF